MQASYNENSDHSNVHNDKARNDQVTELVDFVYKKISDSYDLCIVAGDFNINARANRGDPVTESEEYKQLMTAFKEKLPDFEIRNQVKDTYGYFPCTYADITRTSDGKIIPKETVLTNTTDFCTEESIDYIFSFRKHKPTTTNLNNNNINSNNNSNHNNTNNINSNSNNNKNNNSDSYTVTPGKSKVREFFVDNLPVTQLSDHYGISLDLFIKNQDI